MNTKRKHVYFCAACGSFRVQVTAWILPNKGDAIAEGDAPLDSAWCERCEDSDAAIEVANREDDGTWSILAWTQAGYQRRFYPTVRKMVREVSR